MNLYARLLHLFTFGRRRPEISIWDVARTPFRVLPNDLDINMHMNNGRYLTLLDIARIDMMVRSGAWKKAMDAGWYGVVASQDIKYLTSLKPFQKFEVHTRMIGHDGKNMLVEQKFMVGEKTYAIATVKTRWLYRKGGSVPISEMPQVVGEFPEHFGLISA
ncbi:acyl-CoA thioesterase [Nocardioides yefusunii]|uniref:Acyl-CoA thioesterase n=1 Tax=Nocardioides yefusunii TaxID=2500546 RepID=A0ABW1R2E6_9ACTN|nr:acyl-CoA thioesterase [Nocardioides yefusunii]